MWGGNPVGGLDFHHQDTKDTKMHQEVEWGFHVPSEMQRRSLILVFDLGTTAATEEWVRTSWWVLVFLVSWWFGLT